MAFEQRGDGVLRYQGRLCVPRVDELQERILEEDHSSRYSIHLGSTKMYRDLGEVYWWSSMKKGIAEFVAKCPNCQQVKVEHQRPVGMAQNIELPKWKWEMTNMDFITGLPRPRRQHDSIWVFELGVRFYTLSLLRVISFEDECSQGRDIVTPLY
ncbi:hypothetical protein MTR67_038751 [Solanum verrucosum]|uniref:Integrase zinc-binding domain-containing protein n=1 Tax=Solanum verrucosum TaxID=315347 RepID=A0AAF0UGU4_SOLVR|nr:hypothetical protein MTR67_038751 [Solanum verrucosum]